MLEEEYIARAQEVKDLTLTNKLLLRFLKRLAIALQHTVNGTTVCKPPTIQTAGGLTTTMAFVQDIGGIIIILC